VPRFPQTTLQLLHSVYGHCQPASLPSHKDVGYQEQTAHREGLMA
jgi:hypothetical protein